MNLAGRVRGGWGAWFILLVFGNAPIQGQQPGPVAERAWLGRPQAIEATGGGRTGGTGSGILNYQSFQAGHDELPPPPTGDLSLPRYERLARGDGRPNRPFTVDFQYLGRSDVEGGATNVKMFEVGGAYQHRFPFADRFVLTLRPFADALFLSGPGGDLVLPEQLYKVGFDFQGDFQLNDTYGFSLGITPGFWTDFIKIDEDDVRLPARALVTARVIDGLFVAGGIHYTDNLRRNVLPAFGILWDASDRIRLELVYPRSRLIYFLHDELHVYGVAERGGDTYNLRTGLADEDFEYRDVRVALGAQYDAWRWASFFVETGAAFARKFRFDLQGERDINPSFFLRAGTRF